MADKNFDPNARYDTGPNVAGAGRQSNQTAMAAAAVTGINSDGTLGGVVIRPGQHVAGALKNNTGPNVAGAPRSVNGV